MATLAGAPRSMTPAFWVTVQAAAGGIWAALAWWLSDLLVQEHDERMAIFVHGAGGVLIMLGLMGIGLVSLGVVLWSRAAGLAGGAVLIAGLILGGYGSGTPLLSSEGDLGFIILRGAHEPAIYMLLGAWIGGLVWTLLSGLRPGPRSVSTSGSTRDTSALNSAIMAVGGDLRLQRLWGGDDESAGREAAVTH